MTVMFQVKDDYLLDESKQDFEETSVCEVINLKDRYVVTYTSLGNSGITLEKRVDKKYYELRWVSAEEK